MQGVQESEYKKLINVILVNLNFSYEVEACVYFYETRDERWKPLFKINRVCCARISYIISIFVSQVAYTWSLVTPIFH